MLEHAPPRSFLRLSYRRPHDASPVVVLRSDAADPPLFCVTGAGSPAMSLRHLSDAMPGRNFAAIQQRGLEERAMPDHHIVAAARRISQAPPMQPRGPYTIAGFSYGGIVAFEMGCQLRAEGAEVARLVILDTNAPADAPDLASRARSRIRSLRADVPGVAAWRAAVVAGTRRGSRSSSAYAHARRRVVLSSAGVFPRRGYRQYDLFSDSASGCRATTCRRRRSTGPP